jgi:hypothetical protein
MAITELTRGVLATNLSARAFQTSRRVGVENPTWLPQRPHASSRTGNVAALLLTRWAARENDAAGAVWSLLADIRISPLGSQ